MRDGSKEPGIRPLMAGKPRPPSSKKKTETCTLIRRAIRCFPERILGELDGNRSPTFQGDAFFYYPLADITDLQGLLFTNVDSGESLSELTSIVEKTGRSIEYQTYTDSNLNIFEVLKKMLMDDFVSRSLLCAFLGLVFCAVFAMSMM